MDEQINKRETLTTRPNQLPEIGYEFEHEFQTTGSERTVFKLRVVGYERIYQSHDDFIEYATTVIISTRVRKFIGIKRCNMNHLHEIYEGDSPDPVDFKFSIGTY